MQTVRLKPSLLIPRNIVSLVSFDKGVVDFVINSSDSGLLLDDGCFHVLKELGKFNPLSFPNPMDATAKKIKPCTPQTPSQSQKTSKLLFQEVFRLVTRLKINVHIRPLHIW